MNKNEKVIQMQRTIHTADRLYRFVLDRFRREQPEQVLTKGEQERIWFAISGKLARGETEVEVAEWCKTAMLADRRRRKPMRSGY